MRINFSRLSIGAFFFTHGLIFASWATRIPFVKAKFVLDDAQLGNLLLCIPLGSLTGLAVASLAVTRFGSLKILVAGIIGYTFALLSIGFVGNLWLCVASVVAFGLFGNLVNVAVNTQAVALEKQMGSTIMASFHGLWSLAGFTGGVIGNLAIRLLFKTDVHYLAIAILIFSFFPWFVRGLLRHDAKEHVPIPDSKPSFIPDAFFLRLGGLTFLGMLCEGCMFDWSGIFFHDIVHAATGNVGNGYVAFMSCMALGRFFSDQFTDRLGPIVMLRISGTLIGLGLLAAVVYPLYIFTLLAFALVGLGTSSVVPVILSRAGINPLMSPAKTIAIISSIGFLGFLMGPPLIGYVSKLASLRIAFSGIAGCGFMIALMAGKKTLTAAVR